MKNKTMKKESLIISMAKLIITVGLIVGVGTMLGILVYSETMPKSEVVVNDEVEKEEIKDDEINQDETADWETYRNEEYGFEMKHLKFWLVEKHDISGIIYITTEDIEEMRESYSGDMSDLMTINVYQSTEEFLKEYNYKNFKLIDIEDYLDKYSNIVDSPIENVELFSVAGIKGYHANVRDFGGGINYYIQANEHIYVIWFFAGGEYSSEEFFNQILSTFKFIEKDETSDWKTYRNEKYGFEVKYPEDWEEINKTPAIMSFVCKSSENNIIQIRNMDRENDISLVEQIKGRGNIESELIKINNKNFYFLKTSLAGLMFYEYYIENENKIFIISMMNMSVSLPKNTQDESDIIYQTDEELSMELDILKTMVSTFKFIEK